MLAIAVVLGVAYLLKKQVRSVWTGWLEWGLGRLQRSADRLSQRNCLRLGFSPDLRLACDGQGCMLSGFGAAPWSDSAATALVRHRHRHRQSERQPLAMSCLS